MLHTVVVDAQALAALDHLFTRTGEQVPRSAVVERRAGIAWYAIPIDADTITAIQCLRRTADDNFNDCLRVMLDLPPLATCSTARQPADARRPAWIATAPTRACATR